MYVDSAKNQHKNNFRWILPYCRPDAGRIAAACVLFAADKVLVMLMPILAGMIVDQVITQGHRDRLPKLCICMIAVTLGRSVCRYGYQMFMERFGQNAIYRLVSDEYEKLHDMDFSYFNHTRNGDIMSRMTSDTDAIRHFLSWVSYNILDAVCLFAGSLVVMFTIEWRLALALLAVTPFLFIFTWELSRHAHPLFYAIRNSLASLNSMVEENIEGNRVVKAFVREPYETKKFDKHNDDYMEQNMRSALNSRIYMPWLDGCSYMLQLITLILGGWLVIRHSMTLGALVSFNSFLWMIDGPVRQSGWLVNDVERFNASCVKIRRLLTARPRILERPDAKASVVQAAKVRAKVNGEETGDPVRIRGGIRFDHVSFVFPDDPETPILKDIDFQVPPGTKLGILGETGSGKSTMVSLIARFYDPTVGHVLIDEIDAREWPLDTLRRQVNIVAQDTFLFSDTIGDNIAFGAARNDEKYVRNMASMAGADTFIDRMPQGYDTVVGERGVGLSGGQKQRLSLARALADDPAILIMDDTTSAVDMETEATIQRHLQEMEGARTMVTIAHRISSIKDSDLILVLDRGRIVERGSHDDLVHAHGRYYRIYRKQLGLQSGESAGF